tara:strand:+ start:240 stop:395 length:156 start_codon:yes stop_codon:yes gene_type:complete
LYYEQVSGLHYERIYTLDDRLQTPFSVLEGFAVIRNELAKIAATLSAKESE